MSKKNISELMKKIKESDLSQLSEDDIFFIELLEEVEKIENGTSHTVSNEEWQDTLNKLREEGKITW
jgi:hypothetical protein